MPTVAPRTNWRIHSFINLTLWMLLELAAAVGLWLVVQSLWLWIPLFVAAFFLVGYAAHWWVPRITGPVLDRLFPRKPATLEFKLGGPKA